MPLGSEPHSRTGGEGDQAIHGPHGAPREKKGVWAPQKPKMREGRSPKPPQGEPSAPLVPGEDMGLSTDDESHEVRRSIFLPPHRHILGNRADPHRRGRPPSLEDEGPVFKSGGETCRVSFRRHDASKKLPVRSPRVKAGEAPVGRQDDKFRPRAKSHPDRTAIPSETGAPPLEDKSFWRRLRHESHGWEEDPFDHESCITLRNHST